MKILIKLKDKLSVKRLLITIILVVLSASLVGYIIWYKYNEVINSQQKQIDMLQNQANTLNEQIDELCEDICNTE